MPAPSFWPELAAPSQFGWMTSWKLSAFKGFTFALSQKTEDWKDLISNYLADDATLTLLMGCREVQLGMGQSLLVQIAQPCTAKASKALEDSALCGFGEHRRSGKLHFEGNLRAEQPLVADCAVLFSTFEDVAGVGASERWQCVNKDLCPLASIGELFQGECRIGLLRWWLFEFDLCWLSRRGPKFWLLKRVLQNHHEQRRRNQLNNLQDAVVAIFAIRISLQLQSW